MRRSVVSLLLLVTLPVFAADTPVERPSDTWDFSKVYPSVDAWETAVKETSAQIEGLESCRGQLATKLRPCLDMSFNARKETSRIYTYASNQSNADTRDGDWQGRSQRAGMLWTTLDEKTSFFRPEILALGAPAVEAALKADPGLAPYDHYLRRIVQDAAHTLDANGEALLASAGNVLAGAGASQELLINSDLPWPSITLSDGSKVTLTSAAYTNARALPNRADRQQVFEHFFGALDAYKSTLGSTLNTAVQGHWMIAKDRHYPTSVAAALDSDHLPPSVYTTLVSQTNKNLPTLHRYLRLRGKMLGVSDLHAYDMYPPLVAGDRHWTVDEAMALTVEATRPLGADYTAALQQGFAGRWMDVYPRPGKSGGAYMDGAAYDVHPFLLLNYTGDYDSVSTLAHEWGHALHSVLSARSQPYPKADYATFIAEIASTFNEALLLQQMLKTAKDDDERLYYLGNALEGLRTTYFRQAQFAEFELAIHQQVEQGQPLTGDSLNQTYLELVRKYYGEKEGITKIDDLYGVEWAYIPHFYYNFYVFQYATSIAASSLLADDVLSKKPGALDRYLGLLKAGGSDDPYPLLLKAGVDMASPAPYDAIARRMDGIMDQMEAILAKKEASKGGKPPRAGSRR